MGADRKKQIIDEFLLNNAFILLRNNSIDWNDKTGEFYKKDDHTISIYSSWYSAEHSMGDFNVYKDKFAWYRYMPLIGEIPVHKEDDDSFDILDFLYLVNKKYGIDKIEYDNYWMDKVEIKSILSFYNYDNSQISPKTMRIKLCKPDLYLAPNRYKFLNELRSIAKKQEEGFRLIGSLYTKYTFEDCFQMLALCPHIDGLFAYEKEYFQACVPEKNAINNKTLYFKYFKALLEFVVFSYIYKGLELYVYLNEDGTPVINNEAIVVTYKTIDDKKLLPVNGIDELKNILKKSDRKKIVLNDGGYYSVVISEDIVEGVIPTTYFPWELETRSTKILNIDGVNLPKEIMDKINDDFEQRKYEDEHTPKMWEVGKYAREWGFDYDQYIKYIINGEDMT